VLGGWGRGNTINPRVASRCKELRREALDALRAFWRAYAEALAEYRAGNHDVVFPPGTYKMRVFFNVPCPPPPLAQPKTKPRRGHPTVVSPRCV